MNKKILSIISATLLATFLTACSKTTEEQTTTTTNYAESTKQTTDSKEAFDFLAKDIDGNDVRLSDFKGKKVYINLWASWCGPCIKEIPELEKVYQKVKSSDDIVFLSMTSPSDATFQNMNPQDESKKVILDKANELGVTYPVLFDVQDRFMINYNIRSFPTHIFINSDGTIHSQIPGMMNEQTLEQKIAQLK